MRSSQNLGDKEGIAACLPVQLVDVDSASCRHCLNADDGQWMQSDASDALCCCKVAKYLAKRVKVSDLIVTEGCNEKNSAVVDASCKKSKKIERRFVCPVYVLEGNDGCCFQRERREHVAKDFILAVREVDLVGAEPVCNVEQGAEGSRCGQGVAGSDEERRAFPYQLGESSHEPALSDPCLAADKHKAAVAFVCLGEEPAQLKKNWSAFEEVEDNAAAGRVTMHALKWLLRFSTTTAVADSFSHEVPDEHYIAELRTLCTGEYHILSASIPYPRQ